MMWTDTISYRLIAAEIMLSYKQSKLHKKFTVILENIYSLAMKIVAFLSMKVKRVKECMMSNENARFHICKLLFLFRNCNLCHFGSLLQLAWNQDVTFSFLILASFSDVTF